jgi:CheY-like chemotaxis protein
MDAATMQHLFEPFFTTKGVGKGTGLGLATVYGIVSGSGGFIDVASEPGRGAAFTIYLPATRAPAPTAAEGPGQELPGGSETVLLVEDEDMVRNMTRLVLERCGYTVLEARQGVEALTVGAAHDGPLDLVLTDAVMPEMGGLELVRRLTAVRRGLKVLFMSGYTDDRGLLEQLAHDETHVLQKPFTPASLSRKVRQVLNGWAGPPPGGSAPSPG